MDPRLEFFVAFLDRNKIRATYQALAEAAEVSPRSVGSLLGDRCHLASWVVNGTTGRPTGYSSLEEHPHLLANADIIRTGDDLIRRIKREPR